MLQSVTFHEGNILAAEKQVDIPLPDDDAVAFEVVLNAVHGRLQKVPKKVDLTLLTKLAVLIDKYHVHEVMEMYSEQWFNNIKTSIT